MDSAWEQEKLEARKMLEKPHAKRPSVQCASGVGRRVFHYRTLIRKGNFTSLYFKYAEINIDALNGI